VLYAIVRVVHAAVAGGRGILTPVGRRRWNLVALGFAAFILRLLAIIVVPMVVVYRLVMRVLRRWTRDEPPRRDRRPWPTATRTCRPGRASPLA